MGEFEPYRCCSCGEEIVDAPGESVSFDLVKLIFFCNKCADVLRKRLVRKDLGL